MGHIVFELDSRCPLIRCITDQDECRSLAAEMQEILETKNAHTGAASIEGNSLHGLRWGISINLGWMCFTHPYYNKVRTRII